MSRLLHRGDECEARETPENIHRCVGGRRTHLVVIVCAAVGLGRMLCLGREKYTYIGVCLRGIIVQGIEGPL